jgi:hypothetical protein
MDAVLKRLFCDSAFRRQLRRDAAAALAGYDLTAKQRQILSRLQKQKAPKPPGQRPRLVPPPREHGFSRN